MKHFIQLLPTIFFVLTPSCAVKTSSHLRYSIQHLSDRLSVTLSFKGNDHGQSLINVLDTYGPVRNLSSCIKNVVSTTSHQRVHQVNDSTYRVVYPPGSDVQLQYHVLASGATQSVIPLKAYEPMVSEQMFHVLGTLLLISPEEVSKRNLTVSVEWTSASQEFPVLSHLGFNQRRQEFRVSDSLWNENIFLGGDYRVYPITLNSSTTFFAVRGTWSFTDEEACVTVDRIVRYHRMFWNDFENDSYVISLTPVDLPPPFLMGTGLSRSFIAFAVNDDTFRGRFKYLMSHEFFHHWLGNKIKMASPEFAHAWFSEGFTEYYSYKSLVKSGLISREDFVDEIIKIRENHESSRVKENPNEFIEQFFTKDAVALRLPYNRGLLYALYLEKRIQDLSDGKRSLDELMRLILWRCQQRKLKFSNDLFVSLLSGLVGEDFSKDFSTHILEGKAINFEASDLVKFIGTDDIYSRIEFAK